MMASLPLLSLPFSPQLLLPLLPISPSSLSLSLLSSLAPLTLARQWKSQRVKTEERNLGERRGRQEKERREREPSFLLCHGAQHLNWSPIFAGANCCSHQVRVSVGPQVRG